MSTPPPPVGPLGGPTQQKQPVWLWVLIGTVAFVILLCGIGAVGASMSSTGGSAGVATMPDTSSDATPAPETPVPTSTEAAPAAEPEPTRRLTEMPDLDAADLGGATGQRMGLSETQRRFLTIVGRAQAKADGANEIRVVQARKARGRQACRLLGPTLRTERWIGVVDEVGTNLGGDSGVLEVSLADGVKVGTWNNTLSDIGDDTLIEESSPVWKALATLQEGDVVEFSATFLRSSEGCLRESSLLDVNGVLTPTFIARFTEVSKRD